MASAAALCDAFLRAYHNENWDHRSNGERRVLEACGPPARVVFDVGAFIGDWAQDAKQVSPEATVHCFELAAPALAELYARLGTDPSFVLNGFGLAAEAADVAVWHNAAAPSLTSVVKNERSVTTKLEGRVVRGDDYLSDSGIDAIDVLKVDVEGSDLEVLRGFSSALARRAIRVVQFEYGLWTAIGRHMLADFYDLLAPSGYVIGKIYPGYVDFRSYAVEDETFRGGNFVAVLSEEHALIGALSGVAPDPVR